MNSQTPNTSIMNSPTPIVFIHRGKSGYLPHALSQAKFASPGTNIVLLGDELALQSVESLPNIHAELLENLECEGVARFKKYYSHMCSSSKEYEIFCWLRWFYLLEYMNRNCISSVFYFDSDVLLYDPVESIEKLYQLGESKSCGFLIPQQKFDSFFWAASAHISYWHRGMLMEFCEFCIDSFVDAENIELYRKKYNYHLTENQPGGICDMTSLYLFWKLNSDRIENLLISRAQNVFDNNFNCGSNYELDEYIVESNIGIKKVEFSSGYPYLRASKTPADLFKVHALHFQGGAKVYMAEFSTYMNDSLRAYFRLKRHLKSSKRYLKSTLLIPLKLLVNYFPKIKSVVRSK
jgi:hypothetical protein